MSDTATIDSDALLETDNLPDMEVSENDNREQDERPPLLPVESLRDEQTQLEAWVHQSFSALERLHSELDEWQRELTVQQTDLDTDLTNRIDSSEQFQQLEQQRDLALQEVCQLKTELEQCQASLNTLESYQSGSNEQQQQLSHQYEQANQELSQVLKDVQQLEDENAEQSQELEELDRVNSTAQAELKAAREHSEQLLQSLESERHRSSEQQQHWSIELREMRLLLGRQCDLMARGSGDALVQASVEPELKPVSEQVAVSSADSDKKAKDEPAKVEEKINRSNNSLNSKDKRIDEIRRRAKNRRASKKRNRKKSDL